MLESFSIEESPVFNKMTIYFAATLNVFSGPSGSGKSLFLEHILALFGLKDPPLKSSIFSAIINIDDDVYDILIHKDERAKYFINGTPASKVRLKKLLSPFLHYISLNVSKEIANSYLLELLDFPITPLLTEYQEAYKEYERIEKDLELLNKNEKELIEMKDFLTHEITSIERLNPSIGEYERLLEDKKQLSRKEKLLKQIEVAKEILDRSSEITSLLNSLDVDSLKLEDALNEAKHIIFDKEDSLNTLDEEGIENLLNRIESLARLNRKYGSIEATLKELEIKKHKLASIENIESNKEKLEKLKSKLEKKRNSLGLELHTKRLDGIPKVYQGKKQPIKQQEDNIKTINEDTNEDQITNQTMQTIGGIKNLEKDLNDLCALLELSTIEVALETKDFDILGCSKVNISMQGNDISGFSLGEFNRLRLALICLKMNNQSMLNKESKDNKQTETKEMLILDEIDANLSGAESEGVAKVLSMLGDKYQIFSISHQTHMPALSSSHFLISKQQNKSTCTLLDKQAQELELARMISGKDLSKEAIMLAKKKLEHK